jgi:hypothetical protein
MKLEDMSDEEVVALGVEQGWPEAVVQHAVDQREDPTAADIIAQVLHLEPYDQDPHADEVEPYEPAPPPPEENVSG